MSGRETLDHDCAPASPDEFDILAAVDDALERAKRPAEWRDHLVLTCHGNYDTNIKSPGTDYRTVTLGQIFGQAEPAGVEKVRAPAVICSSYNAFDGREHEAQRLRGRFVAIPGDIDKGDTPLEAVQALVREFFGEGVAHLVYSTASSTANAKRWRTMVPLAVPVAFEQWNLLCEAFYGFMESRGCRMDWSLARAAQLAYLPNVPTAGRTPDGKPKFFVREAHGGRGLTMADGVVQRCANELESQRRAQAREHERARAEAAIARQRRLERQGVDGEGASVVQAYNGARTIEELFAENGYEQSPSDDADWRSVYQSSGSFATRVFGDYWISLSESDAQAKLGAATKNGHRFGDAFDIYCHFSHGGNVQAAVRAAAAELGISKDKVSPMEFDVLIDGGGAAAGQDATNSQFAPIPLSRFLTRSKPRWHVKGLIPQAEMVMVYGSSGDGKSFWTLDVVSAVARRGGGDWCGRKVQPGRVAYVVAEGAGGFVNRIAAYLEHHGLQPEDLELEVIPAAPNLAGPNDVVQLISGLKARGPFDLVVLDTLAAVSPGVNENSSEMNPVLSACRSVHAALGATVILVHHAGKDVERGARGWSGIRAAMDAEIEIARGDDMRRARITKMKDGADDAQPTAFRLQQVHLGMDEDGEAETSCVVIHEGIAVPKVKPGGEAQQKVFEKFKSLAEFGTVSFDALVEACVDLWELPQEGKKDRRKELARKAIVGLVNRRVLHQEVDELSLPGDASSVPVHG